METPPIHCRTESAAKVLDVLEPTPAGDAPRECTVTLRRLRRGDLVPCEDTIAVEEDIAIRIPGRPDDVLSRTPGDDLNLVTGHLFCGGVIDAPGEVVGIGLSGHGPARAEVTLRALRTVRRLVPERRPLRLPPERLFWMKETFERRQNLFKNTGSTHAAALFSPEGRLLAFGEDVGRHNAFEKAIGRALREGTLNRTSIAMLSSRIAVGLAARAARADIPVLCGFSAATSSGVEYARERGLTLVGRLKGGAMDVYANAWRLEECGARTAAP